MRFGLRSKVLAGYGIILLLIVLVLVWAIHNLLRLGQASDAILSENYQSILAAENMIDALEGQDSGVLLFFLGFEEKGTSQFHENARKFSQWFARADDNVTIEGEDRIIARIDSSYSVYLGTFTRFMQASAASGQLRAQNYHESFLPAFLAVRWASIELRDLNQRTMYVASESAKDISRAAILSMTAVGLLAIGLALAFSFVLSDRLIKRIRRVHSAAVRIAEGNYDVEMPSDDSDELGQLAEQFNVMAARLRTFRDLNVEQIVAEKRKSEAVIRSIDDGIIAVDAELHVIDINPAAAGILGVNIDVTRTCSFEDVIGDNSLFTYVRTTLQTGRPPDIDERDTFLTLSRQDRESHYQYAVTPVRTPGGQMLGAIVLFRDVTRLKEMDRLKSEFVAIASHELQTPLTSIGMSIGLLNERIADQLPEGDRELLEVAGEEVDRLRRLVRDLLDLSKIEAGKIEMHFDAAPVPLLMKKAMETLRSQAAERTIALESEAAGNVPAARADANKITWVLTNLISNALRYTKPGGHIRLSAKTVGNKIHVSVSDNGVGIPYEYQPKIFEKFVQVNEDDGKGGSGLGLAICKEIVRAHGGSIWVDSTPGAGSTFTFTLPMA